MLDFRCKVILFIQKKPFFRYKIFYFANFDYLCTHILDYTRLAYKILSYNKELINTN